MTSASAKKERPALVSDVDRRQEILLALIAELIRELHPELSTQPRVTLDSLLDRDLGLDSLARMELLARMEKSLEVRLPEKVLIKAETPRDIFRALAPAPSGRSKSIPAIVEISQKLKELPVDVRAAKTLNEVLELHARTRPQQTHLRIEDGGDHEVDISYGALYEGASALAAGLQQQGLEPGDTVALMLPTGTDYFFSFFAVLLAGCTPVPLYPPARPSQIEEHLLRHQTILANAQAKILLTVPEIQLIGKLLQAKLDTLRLITTVEKLLVQGQRFIPTPVKEKDIALIQYTSGSTGTPKGVVLSHYNILSNISAMGDAIHATHEDVFVSWLPLYHDMGLIGAWLGSLYFGCRLVIMPPLFFLARPQQWLWAIHRHRGTLSASPNFGYELCCRRISEEDLNGLDLSSWRLAFNGAEAVSPDTLTNFADRFGSYGFRATSAAPVYGLAESSVGLTFPPLGRAPVIDRIKRGLFVNGGFASPAEDNEPAIRFVACGRPLRGHQIRIVDPAGRELPERQEGRLQFRGPSATSGYLRNPEETRKLFIGEWLDSADLAYIASGDLFITSRVKDIIIRGGRNIYPQELEEAIGTIAGIRKGCIAVFGSTDPDSGTERMIVLAETTETAPEALMELRRSITEKAVDLLGMPPDDIRIAGPGTVLKTSSGKIRRSACKNLYEQGLIGRKKRAVWLQLARISVAGLPSLATQWLRRTGDSLYAAYCWLLLAMVGLPLWLLLMVIPLRRLNRALARLAARLLFFLSATRIETSHRENSIGSPPPVLVANHMSYLDSLVLTAVLPVPCAFVAKAELSGHPLLRLPLQRLGTVFVDRFDAEQGLKNSREISRLAAGGETLLFFAEGTLQRIPGLLPFQMGPFVAAAQNGIGVLPVTITGTRNKLRSNSWFRRKGPVKVVFSRIIMPHGNDWQAALTLRNLVREEILSQTGEPDLAVEYSSLLQMDIKKPEKDQKN